MLARHYTEAGLSARAIPYWQQAGQRAGQRSANAEAISHLTKGLDLLKTLPDTPERAQQELRLQTTLGAPLMAIKGWAASEVERVYTRARELCQQLGETPQLFPVLWGLWGVYAARGQLHATRELGEQCLHLAQHGQDPTLLPVAHAALGQTLYFLGAFGPARAHTEQGIRLYDRLQHRPQAFLYGADPGVGCRGYAAWTLWSLGYPDRALKVANEALVLAQEQSHPQNAAWALIGSAWLYQLRRDGQQTWEQAEAVVSLSTEQGFALQLGIGTIVRGWALAEQDHAAEGTAQICQGLTAFGAMEAETGRSHFLALLAEVYGKVGQTEKGLAVLAEALAVVDKTGERFYEAELYRLKGELLLAQEGSRLQAVGFREKTEKAEECFWQAIEIARRQQAKSLELRAVMSLSRLWQQQGKKEAARQMLTEIYNWFTEGFDTRDLQEAKALLEELEK